MKYLAISLAVLSVMLCASAIQADTTPVYVESVQTLQNKSLTFAGGETLVADDGTNVILTLSDRSASNVRIVMAGSTNVSGDALTIEVIGNDLWGTNTTYMSLDLTLDDTTSGSQDSSLAISTMVAGSESTRLTLKAAGLLVAGNLVTGGGSYTGLTVVHTNLMLTSTNVDTWVDGRFISRVSNP